MSHNYCYSCISISYMISNTYCTELRNELRRNIQLLLSSFNSKKGLQNFYSSLLPRADNLLISSQVETVMWNLTIPLMGKTCCGISILHWRNINCWRHIFHEIGFTSDKWVKMKKLKITNNIYQCPVERIQKPWMMFFSTCTHVENWYEKFTFQMFFVLLVELLDIFVCKQ